MTTVINAVLIAIVLYYLIFESGLGHRNPWRKR